MRACYCTTITKNTKCFKEEILKVGFKDVLSLLKTQTENRQLCQLYRTNVTPMDKSSCVCNIRKVLNIPTVVN